MLLVDDHPVPADSGGELQELLMDHGVPADQAEGVGGGIGAHHTVHGVHDDVGQPQRGEHLGGAGGHRGFVHIDAGAALLLTDTEGIHADNAQCQADDAGQCGDEQGIHVLQLRPASRWAAP